MARAGDRLPASEGVYYFNARWYDAQTGRFLSEDPVLDGTLWFAYVANNPMTLVDPRGTDVLTPGEDASTYSQPDTEEPTPQTVTEATDAPTVDDVVDKSVDEFEQYRAAYIEKYRDPNYSSQLPLKEGSYVMGTRDRYPDGSEHFRLQPGSVPLDLVAEESTPIYATSDQTFRIDEKNPFGIYPSRWAYGNQSYSPTKKWPDVITQGESYGYHTRSYDEKGMHIYAHQDPASEVAKDFDLLQRRAFEAGLTSFGLPRGTQIGTVGMTGETNDPHLHYEYPR